MEIVFRKCSGLDVQRETIVACALNQAGGRVQKGVRTFRLSTSDLLSLHDWLAESGVTHVAMEGTVLHWKPVFYHLDGSFTVLLTNLGPMKSVPGRRAGVEDCEWMADLLSRGLVQESFVPPEPIRELRELLSYRKSLGEERLHKVNHLEKILALAHLPGLSSFITDAGFSKRAVLEVLVPKAMGEEVLTELTKAAVRNQLPLWREVLRRSSLPGQQQFMLEQILLHLDFLTEAFGQVSEEVQKRTDPFLKEVEPLKWAPAMGPPAPETLEERLSVICANCKKIRSGQGNWTPIESYLKDNFAIQFSHTVCPDCGEELYPGIYEEGQEKSGSGQGTEPSSDDRQQREGKEDHR